MSKNVMNNHSYSFASFVDSNHHVLL